MAHPAIILAAVVAAAIPATPSSGQGARAVAVAQVQVEIVRLEDVRQPDPSWRNRRVRRDTSGIVVEFD